MKLPRPDRLNSQQATDYLRTEYGYEGGRRTVVRRMEEGVIEAWRVHPRKKNSWWYTSAAHLDEYAESVGWQRI